MGGTRESMEHVDRLLAQVLAEVRSWSLLPVWRDPIVVYLNDARDGVRSAKRNLEEVEL
jgi:hypothetical protein